MSRPPRLILPVDPQRPTGWVLAELLYCLIRDVVRVARAGRRGWRRAHRHRWVRTMRAILVAGALAVGGAAADQHYHLLRFLLPVLVG